MSILAWKHGETPDVCYPSTDGERLQAAGISDKVTWDGNRSAQSSVGWGTILNLVGRIEPEIIFIPC